MLNMTGMLKAPEWRVLLKRKKSLNEAQNIRQKTDYVNAQSAEEAMKKAARRNPEFMPESAERAKK